MSHAVERLSRCQLARTGDVGAVRHRVRRSPASRETAPARAVRGSSASQGLRTDEPRREAVARRRRRRRAGRGMIGTTGVSIVNDAVSNFWLILLIKTAGIMAFFLMVPLGIGYMEHKVLAHMQHRLGPMYAGRFHGWAQLIADGVKFIQKEDVIPRAADSWVFSLAPAVVMVPYIAIFLVIPFGYT